MDSMILVLIFMKDFLEIQFQCLILIIHDAHEGGEIFQRITGNDIADSSQGRNNHLSLIERTINNDII